VRLFAVRGLGHVVNDAVAPHLIARLRDDSAAVRTEAVTALARGERFDTLDRVRDDESFHVRAAVARALAAAHTPDSLKVLRELAQDRAISVQVTAIEALAQRLGPAVVERLEEWASHEDWRIRVAAARVVGQLGDAGTFGHIRAAADPDLRIRAALLAGLEGQSAGDEIVLAALESDDLAIRAGGVERVAEREHLDRLTLLGAVYDRSAGEDWIEVRESIVDALGTIPDSEQLSKRIASTDDAPSVRRKAGGGSTELAETPQIELSPWIESHAPDDAAVDLETRHGTMRIALFAADAPIHVAAFLERVDRGFYDGLIWHRVAPNFVIQGGDPRGDGWGGAGYTIRDEINMHRYVRGSVGMPKAGKDTGGCQIFITHVPTPHLDGNYTIFGQVTTGLDVVDRIEVGDRIVTARLKP
jgi:cyclophilin family peptidyl-prolyl cis-trans isomerase/HEAT repeat protein